LPAYVIYQADVTDEARYEEYKVHAGRSVVAAGGKYLVRGGDGEALEGELPASRTVVLEFPTRAAALTWYESPSEGDALRRRRRRLTALETVADGPVRA